MAKNFLDQALSLIGLKPPNATDYYDPSVYSAEVSKSEVPSKVSNVEQYQQTRNTIPAKVKQVSSVEKYLAKKQQPEKEKITTETATVEKLTGVAKYLAIKQQEEQAALANMTGVARYLYNLKTNNKKTLINKTSLEQKETPEKLSRVDMYLLAKQQGVKLETNAVNVSRTKPKEVLVATPNDKVKEEAPKVKEKIIAHAKNEQETRTIEKTTNEIIDLSEEAAQCQAATLKQTQCSRKTSLETIEQTINQQQYKFAVCSQHNKDSFIPFAQFLQQ